MAKLSGEFGEQRDRRDVTAEQVQARLPSDAALLELRAFNPVDFKTRDFGAAHWLALLLPGDTADATASNAGTTLPRLWDLGPIQPTVELIDEQAALNREWSCLALYLAEPAKRPGCAARYAATADKDDPFATVATARARQAALDTRAHAIARALYEALILPVAPALSAYPRLYLAPDGALDLVAFAGLVVPGGDGTDRYWIEERALRLVRTGRDLLPSRRGPVGRDLLALGGIDYARFPAGQGSDCVPAPSGPKLASVAHDDAASGVPPGAASPLRSQRGSFDPLSESGPEAQEVALFFAHEPVRSGRALTGREGAECTLKRLKQAPRVLHLATHGFFLPRSTSAAADVGIERALTLSGLALAGANRGLAGERGADGEDGILYALEVLGLNLEGTDLVTLSACDTGQGRVDTSEGVYGLVRAFQIAGSRYVLMTQWSLNDPLARQFMVDFYGRWLGPESADDPAAALRATQLEWLGGTDPVKSDPRWWAPYVLIERG